MTRFASLLAATDFSDDATLAGVRAALLAKEWGARLTLLHVVSRNALETVQDLFSSPVETEAAAVAGSRTELARQADAITAQTGLAPTLLVRAGRVLEEVVAAAQDCDLMVVGARGANPMRDLMVGTTAERLIRHAPVPALVVRRAPETAPARPYRHLLVPVDFSDAALPALRLALRFAPEARLTLVHAMDVSLEGKMWLAGVPDDKMRVHRAKLREHATTRMEALLEAAGVDRQRAVCVIDAGDAPRVVLEEEKKRDADLIVIGREGQSRVADFLLGSVTRRVLTHARCDVLVNASATAP